MKTSETLPRPLGSAHIVTNQMQLLTPKCSLLIGAVMKKTLKALTGVHRCQGVRFLNSNMWLTADFSSIVIQPSAVVSALQQHFSLAVNVNKIQFEKNLWFTKVPIF